MTDGRVWYTRTRALALIAAFAAAACAPGGGDAAAARDSARATGAVVTGRSPDGDRPADSVAPSGGSAAPSRASDVAALPPSPAPTPATPLRRARDRDQAFLREMLDHHEAALALAHAQMMAPAGHSAHGTSSDPGDVDADLDAEKREMLALLQSLYAEAYSPRAAAADTATSTGADHMRYQTELAAQFRAGVALVDRYEPELRRPGIRALARRLRTSQLSALRLLGEASAKR